MTLTLLDNNDKQDLQEQIDVLKENGAGGNDGFSPTIVVSENTEKSYKLNITDKNGTITTPNLKGDTGADGKTPVVGVDYFTESDKAQIVQSVIESLGGTPVFGYVDEDNNVIVRGLLSDGTYSIKYELEDGTIVKIGELTLSSDEPDTPVFTNQIPLSTDTDGTLYNNGQGFKTGYRISGSSGSESAQAGTEVTGFIPVKYGDTVYLKNIVDDGTHVIALYGSNREKIVALTTSQIVGTLDGSVTSFATSASAIIDATTNIEFAFMRVSATEITADSIITVNEPIE